MSRARGWSRHTTATPCWLKSIFDPLQSWQAKSFIENLSRSAFHRLRDSRVSRMLLLSFAAILKGLYWVCPPDGEKSGISKSTNSAIACQGRSIKRNRLGMARKSIRAGQAVADYWRARQWQIVLEFGFRVSSLSNGRAAARWMRRRSDGKRDSVWVVEDDLADTVKPRLEAAGGGPNVSKIVTLTGVANKDQAGEYERTVDLRRDIAVLEVSTTASRRPQPRAIIHRPDFGISWAKLIRTSTRK